jgi:hypothetical protein
MSDALEIVQFHWWQMSLEHVVVLLLSWICIHPFAFSFYWLNDKINFLSCLPHLCHS